MRQELQRRRIKQRDNPTHSLHLKESWQICGMIEHSCPIATCTRYNFSLLAMSCALICFWFNKYSIHNDSSLSNLFVSYLHTMCSPTRTKLNISSEVIADSRITCTGAGISQTRWWYWVSNGHFVKWEKAMTTLNKDVESSKALLNERPNMGYPISHWVSCTGNHIFPTFREVGNEAYYLRNEDWSKLASMIDSEENGEESPALIEPLPVLLYPSMLPPPCFDYWWLGDTHGLICLKYWWPGDTLLNWKIQYVF